MFNLTVPDTESEYTWSRQRTLQFYTLVPMRTSISKDDVFKVASVTEAWMFGSADYFIFTMLEKNGTFYTNSSIQSVLDK